MVPPPPSSRDAFLPPHIIQQHTRAMRAMGLSHRHAQIKSLSTHLPHGEYQSNLPVPHNSRSCDETNGGAAASCRCSVRLLAQGADRIKGMVVGGESSGVGRGGHCLRGGSWSSGPPCECPLAPPPTCRLPLEAACTCPRSIPRIHRGGTPAAGVASFSLRVWAKQSRLLTSNRAHDGRGGAFIYPWAAKFCSRQSQRPSGPQLVSGASASNSGTGRQAGRHRGSNTAHQVQTKLGTNVSHALAKHTHNLPQLVPSCHGRGIGQRNGWLSQPQHPCMDSFPPWRQGSWNAPLGTLPQRGLCGLAAWLAAEIANDLSRQACRGRGQDRGEKASSSRSALPS